jgi:hypothetical protein
MADHLAGGDMAEGSGDRRRLAPGKREEEAGGEEVARPGGVDDRLGPAPSRSRPA